MEQFYSVSSPTEGTIDDSAGGGGPMTSHQVLSHSQYLRKKTISKTAAYLNKATL